MGDHYNWLVDYLFPQDYVRQAQSRGMDAHALLTEKAQALLPGQSGLLALDWWNGNRSMLVDGQLSGLMLGMTLRPGRRRCTGPSSRPPPSAPG